MVGLLAPTCTGLIDSELIELDDGLSDTELCANELIGFADDDDDKLKLD